MRQNYLLTLTMLSKWIFVCSVPPMSTKGSKLSFTMTGNMSVRPSQDENHSGPCSIGVKCFVPITLAYIFARKQRVYPHPHNTPRLKLTHPKIIAWSSPLPLLPQRDLVNTPSKISNTPSKWNSWMYVYSWYDTLLQMQARPLSSKDDTNERQYFDINPRMYFLHPMNHHYVELSHCAPMAANARTRAGKV